MKKLILTLIGFAIFFNVQAQNKKPVLKADDKMDEKVSEIAVPGKVIESEDDEKNEKVKVKDDTDIKKKKPVAVPQEKPAKQEEKLKDRGDSQKPIHERGKGKPEHVREMQKEKLKDKGMKKEQKKDKQKAKAPKKEKKQK